MPITRFEGFVGQSYSLPNFDYDSQRTINWFPEVNENGSGKNAEQAQLIPTPGLYPALSVTRGVSRGGYAATNGVLYWMFGNTLHIVDTTGSKDGFTSTEISGNFTYLPTKPTVQMTDNGIDLFILSGGNVWTYNFTTGVVLLQTNSSANGYEFASSMTFMDSRIVFTDRDASQFRWTDTNSVSSNALNFATGESFPDEVVGVINNQLDLWVFGKTTVELWYGSGGDNVFSRRSNTLIELGCAAQGTIKKIGTTLMWMSSDNRGGPQIVMANGYTPQRVSTFPLEQAWTKFTTEQIDAATAYVYQEGGHHFYVLNIPGADTTWVYDLTVSEQMGASIWHERRYYNGEDLTRHLSAGHVYYKGFHITGDYADTNGKLYVMDNETFTDDGAEIVRERTTPHVASNMSQIAYRSLTLDFYTGITKNVIDDPQVMMQYSDDGGHTWSNEMWASAGKMGDFDLKVSYYRLGVARNRVFRIRVSDPIYWAVSGASINLDVGTH